MKKLAIISTHPIQYNAPWFAMLAQHPEMELKVFYTWSQRQTEFFDDNFGKEIKWDIPLLEGYDYEFVKNRAKKPGNKSFWGIQCPELINRVNAFNPTHILVFGWNFHAHFAAMRHFKGKVPVLFRGDSTLLDYDFQTLSDLRQSVKTHNLVKALPQYLKFKLRKTFLTIIYRHIDMALYVGSNNKDYFKAHGLKEHQLCFVPHAIDNNRFADNKEMDYANKALELRRTLQIKDTDFVVLFAGKFENKKAPLLLCQSFINLDKELSTIHLIFIGNGIMENELKEKANANAKIHFLSFQNQSKMPVVYRLANLFCLPSSGPGETWGLAVNEAMASGCPVLVSNKVGCAIDLANTTPHHVFESGNSNDLAEKIILAYQEKNSVIQDVILEQIKPWSFDAIVDALTNQMMQS